MLSPVRNTEAICRTHKTTLHLHPLIPFCQEVSYLVEPWSKVFTLIWTDLCDLLDFCLNPKAFICHYIHLLTRLRQSSFHIPGRILEALWITPKSPQCRHFLSLKLSPESLYLPYTFGSLLLHTHTSSLASHHSFYKIHLWPYACQSTWLCPVLRCTTGSQLCGIEMLFQSRLWISWKSVPIG